MEYLAKKSFSFLQDFAFISKSILKNIYCFIFFSLVYFFAKNSFISTSKAFYKLCKYVNSLYFHLTAVASSSPLAGMKTDMKSIIAGLYIASQFVS